MDTQLLLKEEHALLTNELSGNLKRKHVLELEISKQFEQLKRLEISMEKNSHATATEKRYVRV
jgi:hypothetical protein